MPLTLEPEQSDQYTKALLKIQLMRLNALVSRLMRHSTGILPLLFEQEASINCYTKSTNRAQFGEGNGGGGVGVDYSWPFSLPFFH